eukprot:CAMPEP_0172514452 /NCGR_PEP_ID=MMETSP1066-20121228/260214_1 /TAXON_ID=671091 /ORGANISM="Coscinodiscus wailesii, Strain CCMP2513" /LENGTH=369 /DNA_ID=CAMNT_0013295121 /DNA_START=19 /DNA_END=1128 /DNA_ORIENTATION=+
MARLGGGRGYRRSVVVGIPLIADFFLSLITGGINVGSFSLHHGRTPGIDSNFFVHPSCIVHPRCTCTSSSGRSHVLRMGKGFNSARNKKAALAKKMAQAKKQSLGEDHNNDANEGMEPYQTEEERKLEEDRARFAQLLRESKVSNPNPYEDDYGSQSRQIRVAQVMPGMAGRATAPKTRKVNDAKRRKKKSAKDKAGEREEETDVDKPLQEGDIAKRADFEPLIACDSGTQLGAIDAARLVPWVPPFVKDFIVILSDPRAQSGDLRRTVQYLTSNLSPDILDQVIAISSDKASETRNWMKRVEVDTPIRMFSDRDWEWMRRYSAVVTDGRWSLSIMVIDNSGVIREIIRDVEPSKASELVINSANAITN